MKTISFLAQKGGSGKTTLAIHIAVLAEQIGLSTVLADIDPQGSCSDWWQSREADLPVILESTGSKLSDIKTMAENENKDLLIIDTPPHSTNEGEMAIQASDLVLIPTRPSILDLRAIGSTVKMVEKFNVKAGIVLNACPPKRSLELSIVREARKGLNNYQLPLFPFQITQRAAFSYSMINGLSVNEYEPSGKASAEIKFLLKWIQEQLK